MGVILLRLCSLCIYKSKTNEEKKKKVISLGTETQVASAIPLL